MLRAVRVPPLAIAVLLWLLLCLRWFDAAAPLRPPGLALLPPWLLALPLAVALVAGLAGLRRELTAVLEPGGRGLLWALALAAGLRLPLAWLASAGYVTSDGALSGIVALRVLAGREHFVFVPAVPYSGSLKSHLTAPLAAFLDPALAFALVSLAFYLAYVAGVHALGRLAGDRRTATWAALYAALAPAFVTQYSLSNDGNYVEVLAFGAWALACVGAWLRSARSAGESGPSRLLLAAGLLLGLGFWCHILAVMLALPAVLLVLAQARRAALLPLLALAGGLALGYWPGLLWNATNGWVSFRYLVPGLQPVGESAASTPWDRLAGLALDHAPLLLGYAPATTPAWDLVVRVLAWGAVGLALVALGFAARAGWSEPVGPLGLLLAATGCTLAVVVLALPYLAGNPRYPLFLMVPLPALLGRLASQRWGRAALVAAMALGTWGLLSQGQVKLGLDRQWRGLVAGLEQLGVRHCYSDFYLATKVNFLSGERVVCSAKLGPTTTEYFFEYRQEVEGAPAAAYVAVNRAQADKLERRLERLGVAHARRDLMKPVLFDLARKVDPQELFPDRHFPLR